MTNECKKIKRQFSVLGYDKARKGNVVSCLRRAKYGDGGKLLSSAMIEQKFSASTGGPANNCGHPLNLAYPIYGFTR